MTERAYAPGAEFGDNYRQLEARDQHESFVVDLQTLAVSAISARWGGEPSETVHLKEKRALAYAAESWPNGLRINIVLPAEAEMFNHAGCPLSEVPRAFLADRLVGFDRKGARFLNISTGQSVRFSNFWQAKVGDVVPPESNYANFE